MMRSPSQWPGTARSSTSAGRSLIMTILGCAPGCRCALVGVVESVRIASNGSARGELTSALDKEGFIDRLVAHPHHRIVGKLEAQAHRDLLGRPPLLQPPADLGASSGLASLSALGRQRPLGSSPVRPPGSIVTTPAVGGHLSRHRAQRTTQSGGNGGQAGASVQPQADLLTLLQHQPTRARRPREWLGRSYRQPDHGVVGAALRDVDLFGDLLELEPLARRRKAIARCSGVRPGLSLTAASSVA